MRPGKRAYQGGRPRRRGALPRMGARAGDEAGSSPPSSIQALHAGLPEVLLHPEPPAVVASVPCLKDWITVPLNNHNALPALINGRSCVLYVDCGTTSAMIAHRLADKLGLLDKVSFVKHYELQLWSTKVRHNLKVVEGVRVDLNGGVSLSCTFLVLPEDMVTSLPDILLDNATLRRAGAVQEFTSSACILYFPTTLPTGPGRRGKDSQYVMDVNLKRMFMRHKKLCLHVDTGATSFYVSPKCLHSSLCLTQAPRCVSLALAQGVTVSSGPVRTAGTDTFDFVLGKEMLARYRCVLDFAADALYFHVENQVFRLKLRKSRTV